MSKVISIVGTRPNFIKATLLSEELKNNHIPEFSVHTGQHYDFELSDIFFKDLGLRKPDVDLEIGSGTHGLQTGKMLIAIEKVLLVQKPRVVVIFGDTNSTLAGALAASKLKIPLIHIEAGERMFLKQMPEENNRIICDHVSDVNCCVTKKAVKQLERESIIKNVFFTGDLMLDLFLNYKDKILPIADVPTGAILLTLHRAENTDRSDRLSKIIADLGRLPRQIIWPMHPRAKRFLRNIHLPKNIKVINPVSYREMLWLETNSSDIITDSGGVQKEAYWQNIPCITVLENTGWTETLKGHWNQLYKARSRSFSKMLKVKKTGRPDISKFGDGRAAKKIVKLVEKFL